MIKKTHHNINIFLENKKWIDKENFKSKKTIKDFILKFSEKTIHECFLKAKFKKFKNFNVVINFILTDDNFLKKLNANFLNKKKPTNVLSFPNDNFFKKKDNFLGEIFLSYERCKRDAKKFRINSKDRTGHLIVHGILHLFGYDHYTNENEKKMINIESRILNSLNNKYY